MSYRRRIAAALAVTAVIGGLISGGSTPALAEEMSCEATLAEQVSVPDELVQRACDILATNLPASDVSVSAAPTIATAWTDVGLFSTDTNLAGAGWPISATCLLTGVITGPRTAYYVLVGVANTVGPATSTTIQCTASPAGLSINQTMPGTTSAGADFSTTLLPGDALAAQKICSYGIAYYLVRPTTMRTNTLACSPL